jgi:STE24 endopeptidase
MAIVFWTALAILGLRLAATLVLAALNRAEVGRHAGKPPPGVAAMMDEPTYRKAVAYTLEKSRFGDLSEIFDTLVLGLVLLSGVLPLLFDEVALWGGPESVWNHAVYLLLVAMLLGVPSLPFEWWEQFRLEQKFGFNQSTPGLWFSDKLKGVALMWAIGFPLLWALLSLVRWVGNNWWLWGFALLFGFQILMLILYPKVILPLFNKLTPLPEGDLRTRLLALGDRTGFRAQAIEVIDGSKRSGHSNAYFTGFGRFRRIVLFDTLISQLTPEELEAVLAHEIGHYRRGHIPKMIALSAAMMFAAFAAVAWLAASPWFNPAFGFPPAQLAPSFLLFGLLSGAITFWFSPVANLLSRRYEYEADAFARDAMGGPGSMVAALRKLAQKNLTNLTPHRWFSGFYYSHPTVMERERALNAAGLAGGPA